MTNHIKYIKVLYFIFLCVFIALNIQEIYDVFTYKMAYYFYAALKLLLIILLLFYFVYYTFNILIYKIHKEIDYLLLTYYFIINFILFFFNFFGILSENSILFYPSPPKGITEFCLMLFLISLSFLLYFHRITRLP